jgi:hypothetical protein
MSDPAPQTSIRAQQAAPPASSGTQSFPMGHPSGQLPAGRHGAGGFEQAVADPGGQQSLPAGQQPVSEPTGQQMSVLAQHSPPLPCTPWQHCGVIPRQTVPCASPQQESSDLMQVNSRPLPRRSQHF